MSISEQTITVNEKVYLVETVDFQVDDSRLTFELCNVAKLLMSYGHIEALARLAMGQAEAHLEYTSAICYNSIKADADAKNEKRTVDQIKNAVIVDDRYVEAINYVNFAREQHARARWACVAMQQKSESLRCIAYRENKLSKWEEQ